MSPHSNQKSYIVWGGGDKKMKFLPRMLWGDNANFCSPTFRTAFFFFAQSRCLIRMSTRLFTVWRLLSNVQEVRKCNKTHHDCRRNEEHGNIYLKKDTHALYQNSSGQNSPTWNAPEMTYLRQRTKYLVGKMKLPKTKKLEYMRLNTNAHNFLHIGPQRLAQKPLKRPDFPLQIGF